ncbi:MAG: uroporphyrinogen-III synthase, partial [Candidatus Competibacter sp.]
LQPAGDFSSEGLLALPQLRAVTGRRIAIVCGEDGRELLVETLTARGARVDRAEVYRRERPAVGSIETLLARWKYGEIGAVTITSGENLRNLFDMLGVAGQDYLCDTPLIVVSTRIRQIAAEYGCRHLLLARDAGDDAIVAALLDLTTNALSPVR